MRIIALFANFFGLSIKLLGRIIGLLMLVAFGILLLSAFAIYLSGDGSLVFSTSDLLIQSSLREIGAFFISEANQYNMIGLSLILIASFPFSLIFSLAILLLGSKIRLRYILVITALCAVFGLALLSYTVFQISMDYRVETKTSQENTLIIQPNDTLTLKVLGDENATSEEDFKLMINQEQLRLQDIRLHIGASEDETIKLLVQKKAKGANKDAATARAETLEYRYLLENNSLYLEPYISINAKDKWRAQAIDLYLFLPEGQIIAMDEGTRFMLRKFHASTLGEHLEIWKMKNAKLVCEDC